MSRKKDEGDQQAPDVSDDRQRRLVAGIQIARVEIHQNDEVGQVIAAADLVRLVDGQHPAALVARPSLQHFGTFSLICF